MKLKPAKKLRGPPNVIFITFLDQKSKPPFLFDALLRSGRFVLVRQCSFIAALLRSGGRGLLIRQYVFYLALLVARQGRQERSQNALTGVCVLLMRSSALDISFANSDF